MEEAAWVLMEASAAGCPGAAPAAGGPPRHRPAPHPPTSSTRVSAAAPDCHDAVSMPFLYGRVPQHVRTHDREL